MRSEQIPVKPGKNAAAEQVKYKQMTFDPLHLAPEPSEWRRSGRFFVIAIALHAAILFYPFKGMIGRLDTPPPNTIMARIEPSHPPSVPEPAKTQPQPIPPAHTARQKQPAPVPRPVPRPVTRPVLAMTPKQVSTSATFTVPAEVATPPAAPIAPVSSQGPPVVVSPAHFNAAYLHNPEPKYPPVSRRLGEEGKVLLKVRVSAEGYATAVDIEKSSNFERLDEAARQIVARWRFIPAKRGDAAIEASVIVPIVFRLDN